MAADGTVSELVVQAAMVLGTRLEFVNLALFRAWLAGQALCQSSLRSPADPGAARVL